VNVDQDARLSTRGNDDLEDYQVNIVGTASNIPNHFMSAYKSKDPYLYDVILSNDDYKILLDNYLD